MTNKPDYASRRFMVVDDQPFMQSLIERMLKKLGAVNIFKYREGGDALASIKDNLTQVDCIISDFNMKPMNGLQFLQAIRAGVNPRIPRDQTFIMLTGYGETEVVKSAVMLDVSGYLVKPVPPDKLSACIERAFARPIDLKDADYYRAVTLEITQRLNDASPNEPRAWVLLSPSNSQTKKSGINEKIAAFRVENATRDGMEEAIIRNRRQCDLGELREGMVLAEDIEAEEGVVLLRKGTDLTAKMVERLRELAVATESRTYVWIGDRG